MFFWNGWSGQYLKKFWWKKFKVHIKLCSQTHFTVKWYLSETGNSVYQTDLIGCKKGNNFHQLVVHNGFEFMMTLKWPSYVKHLLKWMKQMVKDRNGYLLVHSCKLTGRFRLTDERDWHCYRNIWFYKSNAFHVDFAAHTAFIGFGNELEKEPGDLIN